MYATQEQQLQQYGDYLRAEERGRATVEKYVRDLAAFFAWQGDTELTKERTAQWKAHLSESGYAPGSVNTMLSALNGFLRFIGREDCCVKFLRVQRKLFLPERRELTQGEYARMARTAEALGDGIGRPAGTVSAVPMVNLGHMRKKY